MPHEQFLVVRQTLANCLTARVNALLTDLLDQKSTNLGSCRTAQIVKLCSKLAAEGPVIAPLDRQIEIIRVQCCPWLAKARGYLSTWNIKAGRICDE